MTAPVPDNYCDWEWHVPDPCTADDGFGQHWLVDLDTFWYIVNKREEDRTGNLH